MINIEIRSQLINIAVLGQFTLSDFRELEEAVLYKIKFEGPVSLLFDLRDMASLTLDVAWEDIRFTREHRFDLWKIAVVTDSQWIAWSTGLTSLFTHAKTQVFNDYNLAIDWVSAR